MAPTATESSDIDNLWDILMDLSAPFLSAEDHVIINRRKRALLYSLQQTFNDKLSGQINQRQTIGILQRAIYAGVGLRGSRSPSQGESLLGNLLASGGGDCVGLASLYLGLARLFGINMHAAFAADHVFIFFDWTFGNASIETTCQGMIWKEDVPLSRQDGSIWIPYKEKNARIITDQEFLGIVLNNRAIFYYAKKKDWKAVERDLIQAKQYFPQHPDINHNMSVLLNK